MSDVTECVYAEGFKFWEKVYAQVSFNVMAIVGIIGIVLEDPVWAVPYAFVYLYGIPFIVMRHLTCPRCPHLHAYGDCVQLSPVITKKLITGRKSTPFSTIEKLLFYAIFIILPSYPIYWLTAEPVLFTVFLISAVTWYGGQFLHFCKHCRVGSCPFNRTPLRRGGHE